MSHVSVQQAAEDGPKAGATAPVRELPPQNQSDEALPEGWSEERLIDDGGDEIKIRYRGKATRERYEFIRDYLDFKIQRLMKKSN